MLNLPENATSDQILAACLAYEAEEAARLMAEYSPCWEDFVEAPEAEEPTFEPATDDREWLCHQDDIAEAWEEYAAWADLVDLHRLTDEDILIATGCVG